MVIVEDGNFANEHVKCNKHGRYWTMQNKLKMCLPTEHLLKQTQTLTQTLKNDIISGFYMETCLFTYCESIHGRKV